MSKQFEKTKFYFFSGKGGVGKTTMAAASAVYFANQGQKTLIITTDPASNLADVFEQKIGHKVVAIENTPNLFAMELNPDIATAEYKERTLAPLRELIPIESFKVLEEQLNSPCTAEMAAFDRFTDFLQKPEFEIVIFDTAPTGHTLRLLELPVEWSKQLEIKTFTSTGETEVDKITKSRFKEVIDMMQDIEQTTFSFVMYPESTPIEEASRAMEELLTIGIPTSLVVANFILPVSIITNDYLKQRKAMQDKYLAEMDRRFTAPIVQLPLLVDDLIGKEKLKQAGYLLYGK